MVKQYALSPQQFSAVSKLAGPERYAHFVARVADWESIWGLRDDAGWVSSCDDDGNEGFPVWPHPEYAAACANGEWENNQPSPIDVHEFVENWLPEMASKGIYVAVFPTPALRAVFVDPIELTNHLQDELSKLE